MLTNRVPKMRLLLIKSVGDFKHSGKYYLQNGRWHALHHDKPAPKGAAIAAHPHAAGQHLPATLADDQVAALKYPADKAAANHEMKNWNEKHLPELLAHAANGDATAILGMTYGSNTHGKNKAKLANMLLEKMGSKHVVTPGQKAGEHEAVKGESTQAATPERGWKPNPEEVSGLDSLPPAEKKAKLKEWAQKLGGTEKLLDFLDNPYAEVGQPAAEQGPKDGDTKEGADGQQLVFKDGRWHKQQSADQPGAEAATPPADVPKAALPMPEFDGGTIGQSVIDYYQPIAQKVIDLANAGDTAALDQMKADGLKPNAKGKIGNTWKGKTANSKLLLALHAQALEYANTDSAASATTSQVADESAPAALTSTSTHAFKVGYTFTVPKNIKGHPEGNWKITVVDGDILDINKVGAKKGAKNSSFVIHANVLSKMFDDGYAVDNEDAKQGDLPAKEKKEDAALVAKLEAAQEKPSEQFKVTASGYLAGKGDYIQQYANLKQANAKAEKMKAAGYDVHVTAAYPFKIVVNSKPEAAAPDATKAKGSNLSQKYWVSEHGAAKYQSPKSYGVLSADGKKALGKDGQPSSWGTLTTANDIAAHADKMAGKTSYDWVDVYDSLEEAEAAHKAKKAPSLAGKPAFEHMKQHFKAGDFGWSKTSTAETIEAAANEWLAANPGNEEDMVSSLVDIGELELSKKVKAKYMGGAQPAPAAKEPRLVIPKKAADQNPIKSAEPATATVSADPNGAAQDSIKKLDQIPWDGQKLPDSNKNAKSHNKQVEKIKAMAMAGDVAGLEALKFGTNTYGKKQELLKQTAIAALKESGVPADASPKTTELQHFGTVLADAAGSPKKFGSQDAAQAAAKQHPGASVGEAGAGYVVMMGGDASLDNNNNLIMLGIAKLKADQKISVDGKHLLESYLSVHPGDLVGAAKEVAAYGYHHTHDAAMQLAAELAGVKPNTGPKEGDTKQGADGMLVLKDGHWVKVGEEQPAEQQQATQAPAMVKKLSASEVIQLGKGFKTSSGNKAKIKAFAVAGDMEGLKQFASDLSHKFPASKKLAEKVLEAMEAAPESPVGKPKKASTPKPAQTQQAAPAAAAPAIEPMDAWQQTGPQGGSNPGGRFKDPDGVEWYCKFPADEDMAKAEVLSAKLYAALGISGQDAKLITKGGKVGIASKWTSVSKAPSPAALAKTEGVASGFGADAWLGNWDVVGMGFDNLQVGADGKAHRVDAGGSLMYRAQGGKKAFGNGVIEIDSLRDPKINPQAAAVFGGMTRADITASVAKVVNLPDASIRALCFQHGPGSEADRKALAETLIARKADLAAKFPKAGKTPKKRLDPNNLPVDASKLPKRHDFSNWNGPGKGLSSQSHVNAANQGVEQEILDVAKTGNLPNLKNFQFIEVDKATGNATGKKIPISQHPSKHVAQFHSDVVQVLEEIANPPEPLKHFVESEVGSIEALTAAFPPKPFGTTVNSVKSNEKLGFWVVLGAASGIANMAPKKVMNYTKEAIASGFSKYKQASAEAKVFINAAQDSGSFNDLFRDGKSSYTDHSGHGGVKGKVYSLEDLAKGALEHASSQPEGTSIYRWQKMTKAMLEHVMAAPIGSVFQATGPMCASPQPVQNKNFGPHRVVIRYAAGAKAVDSFGSGRFSTEQEVTTLPNSRFVILKKEMVPDVEHGNPSGKRLELEILMLPPDIGIDH